MLFLKLESLECHGDYVAWKLDDCSFIVCSPAIWSALPIGLRDIISEGHIELLDDVVVDEDEQDGIQSWQLVFCRCVVIC
jgi:hypothetical protein